MLNRNHDSLYATFIIFVLQHKHNLEIALHALGHAILHIHNKIILNDIVIEQEHFKHSQFLAKKIGSCQIHLTVHLGGNDSVYS